MASVLARVAAPPDDTVSYGSHRDQVYDVRYPRASAPARRDATVVVVHGGFWRPATDRTHAGSQAAAYAADGFHVVLPEYRRARRAGWPDMRADLLSVLDAVAARPDLPATLVLVGHSAGGHLAAWLAHRQPAGRVDGAVCLAGCVDLRRVHELKLGGGAARALMGSTPRSDPTGWSEADPARLSGPSAPTVLVHGALDDQVPLEISQRYAAAVPSASLTALPRADHFDLIDPESAAFATGLASIRDLVDAAGGRRP